MKLNVTDIKKAINWVEANSRDQQIKVDASPGKFHISCFDRYDSYVEITIFEDTAMMPRITKTEQLK